MTPRRKKQEKELKDIKKTLSEFCEICGGYATDAAHILPRSLFSEHLSNPLNIMSLCRNCHQQFDDNASFRHLQTKFYKRALQMDEHGAKRYFRMN